MRAAGTGPVLTPAWSEALAWSARDQQGEGAPGGDRL